MTTQHNQSHNPLHGITLKMMIADLYKDYGWDGLAKEIPINCFISNPSIPSSLKFLRRTPWARTKVEALFLSTLKAS